MQTTYEDVIKAFDNVSNERALSDEYLRECKCQTREDVEIASELRYGIVYLRDDAVELLIARIKELEKQKGAI